MATWVAAFSYLLTLDVAGLSPRVLPPVAGSLIIHPKKVYTTYTSGYIMNYSNYIFEINSKIQA